MKIALLGATGSIGLQTLDVVRNCLPNAEVVAISGFSNITALAAAAREFRPQVVWVPAGDAAAQFKAAADFPGEILIGEDGLCSCAAETGADVVVNALVGRAGLAPTLAAISAGKNIALANKETLVTAGELVMGLARENGVRIVPIDSEHSAILQCLETSVNAAAPTSGKSFRETRTRTALCASHGKNSRTGQGFSNGEISVSEGMDFSAGQGFLGAGEKNSPMQDTSPEVGADVEKIILTASGGPFRGWSREKIAAATAADALKHPNWDMGAKITIDSATLMNKGLELIEAMHLFSQPPENIEIVVHPQSIIHSAVQFCDGAVLAQMGLPDMRLPILYALAGRTSTPFPRLDFFTCGALTFEPPCTENFPCLSLAIHAAKTGGTLPAVMNFINEWAVGKFLNGEVTFYEIAEIIDKAFSIYNVEAVTAARDIYEAEAWAQDFINKF